jgi:hypothetical protein
MMDRIHRLPGLITTGTVLAAFTLPVAAVAGTPVPSVSSAFCGSSANASNLSRALLDSDQSVQAMRRLARTTVTISRSTATMEARRADSTAASSVPNVAPSTTLCLSYVPGTVLLAEAPTVSGATFAALAAALSYRGQAIWPGAHPAHPDQPGTSLYVETRGPYQYVKFYDDPNLVRGWDTCAGQEFYRVDPRAYTVLPYNGCLVGGNDLRLPRIDELPQ